MIDEIFELIMKEARARKGPSTQAAMLIVLLEVTEKVFNTIDGLQADLTTTPKIKVRSQHPCQQNR